MPVRQYYWYDTEDGQDMIKKLNFAAKITVIGTTPAIAFDAMLNQQKTMRGYGLRYLLYMVPALGMAGMFTFTSQMLCRHVPQVDPKLHYAVAGAAAGSVYGAARRSVYSGCVAGLYLAIAAAIGRSLHETEAISEYALIQDNQSLFNDDTLLARDYSGNRPSKIILPASRPAIPNSALFTE